MFSLLGHYYGYDEEGVCNLTIAQFNARLKDVVEIHNMFQGEGKGRVKRDPDVIRKRIRDKGIRPPTRITK